MTEEEWLESIDPDPMLDILRIVASRRKLRLFACEALRHFVETAFQFPLPIGHRLPNLAWIWDAPVVASRYADGLAGEDEMATARRAGRYSDHHKWLDNAFSSTTSEDPWVAADQVVMSLNDFATDELPSDSGDQEAVERFLSEWLGEESERLADLIREVFGNPFRLPPPLAPYWLAANDSAAARIAAHLYDEYAFGRLPSLTVGLDELAALGPDAVDLDGAGYISTEASLWTKGEIDPGELGILADALEDAGCDRDDILDHLRGPGPHIRGCWALDLILGKE